MPPPSFSAVLVTWNSLGLVEAAVNSLRRQTVPPTQIILVDNASHDGTLAWAQRQADIVTVANTVNRGFAGANNQGIARAGADLILLVNADVELAPDYIEQCQRPFTDPRVGSVTGKLLRADADRLLDSTGHDVFTVGWATNRGEELPDDGLEPPADVFGVCAAAGLYRRAALDATAVDGEVLDASYFAYIEDVDLDWRLRWNGWLARYQPAAEAVHHRHASGGPHSAPIMRHILKNRLLTVVKNYPAGWLLRHGPGIVAFTIVKTVDFGRRRPEAALWLVDFARLLPSGLRKRRAVRAMRRVPAAEVHGWLRPFPWVDAVRRRLS
jgi:GT2 family glycosyltransferase